MLEAIVEVISSVPWYWILLIAFIVTLVENIFPPSPSDSVLVFIGSLISIGTVGFLELLLFSTLGSILGFIIMFKIGAKFDSGILKRGKIKFIKIESIEKVERWFQVYGYKLIVANRFLSGTRAVIAFFGGMSGLNFRKTIILSAISAAIWNTILLYVGSIFGANWRSLEEYMKLYGKILFPIGILIIILLAVRWYLQNKNNSTPQ